MTKLSAPLRTLMSSTGGIYQKSMTATSFSTFMSHQKIPLGNIISRLIYRLISQPYYS